MLLSRAPVRGLSASWKWARRWYRHRRSSRCSDPVLLFREKEKKEMKIKSCTIIRIRAFPKTARIVRAPRNLRSLSPELPVWYTLYTHTYTQWESDYSRDRLSALRRTFVTPTRCVWYSKANTNNRMPELILLIRVAENPRGELRASTVRKPRAAPGAHVARSASTRRFCFQRVPSGRRSDPVTRDSSSRMSKETR